MSEQPCDNFIEHDPCYNRHECPDCLGVRMFCDNCNRDHHIGGWCACRETKMKKLERDLAAARAELDAYKKKGVCDCPRCGAYTKVLAELEAARAEIKRLKAPVIDAACKGEGATHNACSCYLAYTAKLQRAQLAMLSKWGESRIPALDEALAALRASEGEKA